MSDEGAEESAPAVTDRHYKKANCPTSGEFVESADHVFVCELELCTSGVHSSVLSRLILYSNHPLTPSLQRRGTSLTPLLYEEGVGGW